MSSGEKYDKIVTEFNIPVPWGHISVKAWGSQNDPHVVMIHGTADNAGSFDNLIPYLPNSFYYTCIDLPGHGRSSHFPPFVPVHATDYLIACKLVVDYFKKKTYIFIGHSLGGQIVYLFSRLYPHLIEKMISLDALPFFPIEAKKSMKHLKVIFDKYVALQENFESGKVPSSNYDDILEKISKNRYQGENLTKEAAEPLLRRCLIPVGDGKYSVTTDERVTIHFNPLHGARYVLESLKNDPIRCPVLIIFATMNYYPREAYKPIYKQLTKLKNIKIVYVDGKHDVHNKNPKLVATHVTKFLLSQISKM